MLPHTILCLISLPTSFSLSTLLLRRPLPSLVYPLEQGSCSVSSINPFRSSCHQIPDFHHCIPLLSDPDLFTQGLSLRYPWQLHFVLSVLSAPDFLHADLLDCTPLFHILRSPRNVTTGHPFVSFLAGVPVTLQYLFGMHRTTLSIG